MLRGQASLQQLVGREQNFKRKKPEKKKQPAKQARTSQGETTAASSGTKGDRQGSLHSRGSTAGASEGEAECPVCGRVMSVDAIEPHLGIYTHHRDPPAPGLVWRRLAALHGAQVQAVRQELKHLCGLADDCLPMAEARRKSGGAVRATRRLVSRPGRQAAMAPSAKAASPALIERSSPEPAQQPASAPAQMSSPFEARSGPQGGPAAAEDLPADSTVAISTCIVGRRFRATEAVSPGMKVTLRHDGLNPQDASAVMVLVEDTEALLGYVPRQVASALCPLLTEGLAIIEGRIEALGRTSSAPVPITLQV